MILGRLLIYRILFPIWKCCFTYNIFFSLDSFNLLIDFYFSLILHCGSWIPIPTRNIISLQIYSCPQLSFNVLEDFSYHASLWFFVPKFGPGKPFILFILPFLTTLYIVPKFETWIKARNLILFLHACFSNNPVIFSPKFRNPITNMEHHSFYMYFFSWTLYSLHKKLELLILPIDRKIGTIAIRKLQMEIYLC